MFLNILVFLVLIASLLWLLKIVWRRVPELKVLDLSLIPKEKQSGAKIKILEAKLKRQSQVTSQRIGTVVMPLKDKFGDLTKKIKENVVIMERKYKKHEEIAEVRSKSINELFIEADQFAKNEDYKSAEKLLIEVIARDLKNFRAYEMLGEVYRYEKNYGQAEEVIKYLIKLKSLTYRKKKNDGHLKKEKLEDAEDEIMEVVDIDNDLARHYDELAKVYESLAKKEKALDCYLKANAIEPNNPKYLDKVVELAIAFGDRGLAKKTYKRLKEINPGNAKLSDFARALEKMK